MGKRIEVEIGKRYGRLVVTKESLPRLDKKGYDIRRVEVLCDCGVCKDVDWSSLKNGNTTSCGCYNREQSHKNKKLVFGVGVNDSDERVSVNNKLVKSYYIWRGMMERGYCDKYKMRFPTYANVFVCDEWKYFSNFKKWFDENYIEGYQLDKDILIKGNKVYSPNACCFVPREINLLFINHKSRRGNSPIGTTQRGGKFRARLAMPNGKFVALGDYSASKDAFNAYKIAKECRIKEVADKWKDKIDKKVYDAMYAYKVEITD